MQQAERHQVLTWFLPLVPFIEAVTLVGDEDDSEEKKETSMMELLELVFVCCGWAMSGCGITYYNYCQYWKNQSRLNTEFQT